MSKQKPLDRPAPCDACGAPTYKDKRHQRDDSPPPYCALCGSGKVAKPSSLDRPALRARAEQLMVILNTRSDTLSRDAYRVIAALLQLHTDAGQATKDDEERHTRTGEASTATDGAATAFTNEKD